MQSKRVPAISCATIVLLAFAGHRAAQSAWKPDKPVEIVVNTAPGSGPDKTARLMEKIMQELKQPEIPMVVSNKPGGGGAIAYTYLNQYPGNGHLSRDRLQDAAHQTPIAHLIGEYIGIAVRADSAIRSGRAINGTIMRSIQTINQEGPWRNPSPTITRA